MRSKSSRREPLAGPATGRAWLARAMLVFLACATIPSVDAARLKVLILTGESDYPFHDWRSTTPFLRTLLERSGRFEVRVAEEVNGLGPQALASYDLLILNYNGPRWVESTERAIEEFVKSGKGMVALHGVSYGPFFGMEYRNGHWLYPEGNTTGWKAYPDMLGSSWKPENIGHAVRHAFPVRWVDRTHPISQGMAETFLVSDELYHRLDLRPAAHVLACAYDNPQMGGTGKDEPMIWTVSYGKGRVVHTPLGHDTAAMYSEGFQSAFVRSAEWAATGAVTLPPEAPALHYARPVRTLVVTGGHDYPASFYTLFEGYEDIVWSHATSQAEAFTPKMQELYDVVVLHDMYENIGLGERTNLRSFVESGRGVVAIHHCIVDYTSWPWWYERVIGGKFFTQASGPHAQSEYKEGVDFVAKPSQGSSHHPVIRGIGPLVVHDEAYRKMWHSDRISVLMETDEPLNDRPVVYIGPNPRFRSIYIQLGHGDSTIRNPAFRALVHNAILWGAKRTQ